MKAIEKEAKTGSTRKKLIENKKEKIDGKHAQEHRWRTEWREKKKENNTKRKRNEKRRRNKTKHDFLMRFASMHFRHSMYKWPELGDVDDELADRIRTCALFKEVQWLPIGETTGTRHTKESTFRFDRRTARRLSSIARRRTDTWAFRHSQTSITGTFGQWIDVKGSFDIQTARIHQWQGYRNRCR